MTIKAIVTDIEGTTSSISFVHEVLFPYASRALPDFVKEKQGDEQIATLLDDVRDEADESTAGVDRVIEILLEWIEQDRKIGALKSLQGHIWQYGYESGDFTGHLYDDAVTNLRQWARTGIDLYVYSSGSVGAQKLLFGYSDVGDLRPLFKGYFDTAIGHKKEPDAYFEIVQQLDLPADNILFLSDVAEELDAAEEAGMRTIQLVRDDEVVPGEHPLARDFDEVSDSLQGNSDQVSDPEY